MDELLQVSRDERVGVPVVTVAGEVDVSTAPALQSELAKVPEATARLVIDLSGVTFLDSTGIGVLIAAMKRLNGGGAQGVLQLVITRPHILKVLEVTGLTGVFDIHGSLDEVFSE